MTRQEFYKSIRTEREQYFDAGIEDEILLPVTEDGFEALTEAAAKYYDLPVDDELRQVVCRYVHHIDNSKNAIPLKDLAAVLHKSYSNVLTYEMDQAIKAKARAKQEQEKALATPQGDLSVVQG